VVSDERNNGTRRLKERCEKKLHRDGRTLTDGGQCSGSSGSEKYQNNEENDEEKQRWVRRPT
jgi:hypothetical protein